MPNIGRPSRGCRRCRQRKVKCDLRKPGCLRCEKFKQDCPGYAQPEKWLFVGDKAEYASSSSRRQSAELEQISHDHLIAEVPQSLPADLDSSARSFFIRCFVTQADPSIASPGHLEFLPRLFLGVKDESCLAHAFTAVALTNMANHHQANALQWESHITRTYSKALRSTNDQLGGSEAHSDETLASIHLMAMYEILTPKFVFSTWKAHAQGALQLLSIRGVSQVQTSTGRQLFNLILTPLIMKIVASAQLPESGSLQMIRDIQMKLLDESEKKLPVLASSFFFEVGIFTAQTRIMLSKTNNLDVLKLTSWISHGQSLARTAEQSFTRVVSELDDWGPKSEECNAFFSFRDLYVMAQWVKYWAAQLCLYNILTRTTGVLLQLLFTAGMSPKAIPLPMPVIIFRAHHAVENILNCVPFALSRQLSESGSSPSKNAQPLTVGALGINYALEMIYKFNITSDEHKTRAAEGLDRIGLQCGIARNGRLTSQPGCPS